MCDLMKVQSSFRFKGNTYRVLFCKANNSFKSTVQKLMVNLFGFKIWVNTNKEELISRETYVEFESKSVLESIEYLRNFAQKSMGHNVRII